MKEIAQAEERKSGSVVPKPLAALGDLTEVLAPGRAKSVAEKSIAPAKVETPEVAAKVETPEVAAKAASDDREDSAPKSDAKAKAKGRSKGKAKAKGKAKTKAKAALPPESPSSNSAPKNELDVGTAAFEVSAESPSAKLRAAAHLEQERFLSLESACVVEFFSSPPIGTDEAAAMEPDRIVASSPRSMFPADVLAVRRSYFRKMVFKVMLIVFAFVALALFLLWKRGVFAGLGLN
jgi:hypothetical protein